MAVTAKRLASTNGREPSNINPSNSHPSRPIHKAESKPVLKGQTTPKSEPEESQNTEPVVSQHKVKEKSCGCWSDLARSFAVYGVKRKTAVVVDLIWLAASLFMALQC